MNTTYEVYSGGSGGGGMGGNGGGGGLQGSGAMTPTAIRHAYGFDQVTFGSHAADGTGMTIAIVDAFNQPNIISDLAAFDSNYSLPAPPSFKVVNQSGGSSLPANNTGWGLEISLDVEWAHAVAPGANILLVEANSNSGTNLYAADQYAASVAGVVVVSNSWGGGEYSGETGNDNTWTSQNGHPVTFVFSAGDSGAPASFPSASPNVVSVGGTHLVLNANNTIQSESAWTGSGGGISKYEHQPTYQAAVVPPSMSTVGGIAYRTTPDVAYDADPNTGFPVYDTLGYGGWVQVGGTSDAAPQWAALIAIADQGRSYQSGAALDGPAGTLPILYALPQSYYNDITTGSSTGSPHEPAVAGYDMATGRGSPQANLIIPALVDPGPALSAIEGAPLAYTAGNPAVGITSALSLTDWQSTTISSATVSITGNFQSGADALGFTNQNGIAGSYNAATGVLTLTGAATIAQYQAALRSVTFSNFSANPSTATRTVTFQVNDGTTYDNISNTQSRQITVALHVAPVLANIESSTISYVAGQGPVNITGTMTVTDSDSATIASATVAITSNFAGAEDVLSFANQNGITGSYNTATGVLTLTGVSSVANYQTALRSVTYTDGNPNASQLTRAVTFQVNDGDSNNNLSNTQSRNINVIDHVAPILANIETSTLAYTAGQTPTVVTNTMTVTDSDSATIASATVAISAGFVSSEDVLGFTGQNGITGSYNSGTGVLTLSGVATVAQYQTALQSVTYSDSNLLPVAGTRTVTFQVNDGYFLNNISNTQSRNISVTDHVAPVLANIEPGTIAYTAGQGATNVTSTMTVSDSDSPTLTGATVSISSGFVSGEDVLGFTAQSGIVGVYNSSTGVLTLFGPASPAAYQSALQSVTYTDTNLLPVAGTRTVRFQVNDGFANNNLSNTQSRNVSVTDHVAPVLGNIEPGTISYTAGQGAVNITSALTVTDSDSATISTATVSITSGFVSTEDLLSFTNQNGIFGSYNSSTGVLTLSGTASLSNYQNALQSITYTDTNLLPVASTRTVTFQVNDGFANNNLSNTQSRNVSVNDHIAPVLANIESGTIQYTVGQGAVNITSSLTVTDSNSATIASATVAITNNFAGAEDVLSFSNQNGITGSYNTSTGVLTLSGVSSVANYQAALRSVTYTDGNPGAVNDVRTVTFQVDDGFANNDLSNTQSRNISVSTHVPPSLSNIEPSTLAYTAGQAPINLTSSLTVTDSDSTTIASATVTISAGLASAEDVLGFTNQNGITGSYNSGTGVLTLTGVATVAQYQAALQSVTYSDTNLLPVAGTRTIAFQVDDGFASNSLSNTQSRNVAVSDHIAPVLANIEPATISYVSGQGPANITSALTVTDSNSATISSATVAITSNFAGAEDVLSFTNQNGITGSYNAGTGVLTLSGASSIANYQAALRSITYTDSSPTASTATRTVTFQVDDGFANNDLSNTQARNIAVSVHIAPVLANIEPGTISYTAGQGSVNVTSALTVTDTNSTTISSATVTISAGLVSAEDVLGFTNQNGITGSYNSATGVLTLSGIASVANYQAALRSVTYSDTNLLPVAGTRAITFQVNDGWANNNLSNTQSRNVSVTDHTAPVLANIESGTISYVSGQGPVNITSSLTVTDADSATISSATVAISNNFAGAEDVLSFANQNGITGSYNSATGVLTLTGASSVANYQAALRSVTYTDSNPTASTATRTVTFQVDDGFANNDLSNTQSRNIAVSVHVAPVLANIEPGTIAYTAGQGAVNITSALTVTDSNSATISSATVAISSGFVSSEDVLGFTTQNGITGSYNSATGVLTLTGVSSIANYQAALRSVTYTDTNLLPVASTRTVIFQVNDGWANNNISNTQSRNISVTDHVAPVLSNIESGPISYTAGQGPVNITGSLTVTDADSATISSATVAITSNFASAEDSLAFANQNGITGSYNAATGVMTLTGVSSVANYQAALRSVTYSDSSATPSTLTRTVTFQVNDGFANNNMSNTQSRNIGVSAHIAPVLQNIESGPLTYVAGQGAVAITNSMTATDSNSTTIASATVSFTAGYSSNQDVLSFSSQNGITGSFNSATGVLTLTGVSSVANYQAALRSVTYTDTNSVNPSTATRTVAFRVNDGFANNNLSNIQSRNIIVTLHIAPVLANIETTTLAYSVGLPPTPITATMTVTDSSSPTISGATVSVTGGFVSAEDVLGFAAQNGITGSYNAGTGVLTLSGVSSVANYQTALRSVTYQDTATVPNTGTRTVAFQVNDGFPVNNLSNVQSRKISVAAHSAPLLKNIETTAGSYYAGQPPVQVTATLTASDVSSLTFVGATVWINNGLVAAEDVLGFANQNGIVGSYNAGTGVLTLSGLSSIANYQAALRSVTYQDTAISPITGTRQILFQVNDGFPVNNLSNAVARNINVFAHAAPKLANIEAAILNYVDGAPPAAITASMTVTSLDNPTLVSATVSFTAGFVAGQDVLGFTNQNGIIGAYNPATGVLTLQGVSSLANYQAALDSVTYQDTAAIPTIGIRTVTFQANDGYAVNNLSNLQIRSINVKGPPMLVVSGANDPIVRVYNAISQQLIYTLNPFGVGFSDGMRTATGDMNSDGIQDIAVAEGLGGQPQVAIYNGATGQLVRIFNPFGDTTPTGAYVSLANFGKAGTDDVIAGRGQGASGSVAVFNGANAINPTFPNSSLTPVWQFFPYGAGFTGGVSVAGFGPPTTVSGSGNGGPGSKGNGTGGTGTGGNTSNGYLATAPVSSMASWIQVYSYATRAQTARFLAYGASYTLGLTIVAGDLAGASAMNIVAAPNDPAALNGLSNGPVEVFTGNSTDTSFSLTGSITPYSPTPAGGIHVALMDVTGNGNLDIVTAPSSTTGNSAPLLEAFDGITDQQFLNWNFSPGFLGGVWIG